jgi:hypothetical protein
MTLSEHKKQIVKEFTKYCNKHTFAMCEDKKGCAGCEIMWYRNELAKARKALEMAVNNLSGEQEG